MNGNLVELFDCALTNKLRTVRDGSPTLKDTEILVLRWTQRIAYPYSTHRMSGLMLEELDFVGARAIAMKVQKKEDYTAVCSFPT